MMDFFPNNLGSKYSIKSYNHVLSKKKFFWESEVKIMRYLSSKQAHTIFIL